MAIVLVGCSHTRERDIIDIIKKISSIENITTKDNNKLIIDFTGENTNISFYAIINGSEYNLPIKSFSTEVSGFGPIIDDNITDIPNWDKKGYIKVESDKEYFLGQNNLVLERVLTIQDTTDKESFPCSFNDQLLCAFRENDIGISIEKQVFRSLSFEEIPKKDINRFNITIEERNTTVCTKGIDNITLDCVGNLTSIIPVNVSVKTRRDTSFVIYKEKGNWIAEGGNILDYDPSFIDNTKSNFDDFSCVNMEAVGVGDLANLTSSGRNTTGSCGSPVHNANSTVNMTNISCSVEFPYGTELGRANADNNDASVEDIFINTSGLIVLYHFNNESSFGENATGNDNDVVYDFSIDVNSERNPENQNNGTTINGATINKNEFKLGDGSGEFDGSNDRVLLPLSDSLKYDGFGGLTVSLWALTDILGSVKGDELTAIASFDEQGERPFVVEIKQTDVWTIFIGSGSAVATSSVVVGEWNFVVGVWVPSTSTTTYINGVQEGQDTTSIDATLDPTGGQQTAIGIRNRPSPDQPFNGRIDELSIWNRSLSAEEVRNLYMRGAIRLNISVRGCDDSICDGELFELTNTSVLGGSYPLNFSSEFQHIQWNSSFRNNASLPLNDRPVINNCTIEFLVTADTTPPTYLNFAKNVTDADIRVDSAVQFNNTLNDASNDVFNWTFSWNATEGDLWGNVTNSSNNLGETGSFIAIANHSLISRTVGDEIGYTFCSSDDPENVGCDTERTFEILAAPAADTCSPDLPLTADHTFQCSDDCTISSDFDAGGFNIQAIGTGIFIIRALVYNFNTFAVFSPCVKICEPGSGVFC